MHSLLTELTIITFSCDEVVIMLEDASAAAINDEISNNTLYIWIYIFTYKKKI